MWGWPLEGAAGPAGSLTPLEQALGPLPSNQPWWYTCPLYSLCKISPGAADLQLRAVRPTVGDASWGTEGEGCTSGYYCSIWSTMGINGWRVDRAPARGEPILPDPSRSPLQRKPASRHLCASSCPTLSCCVHYLGVSYHSKKMGDLFCKSVTFSRGSL